MRIFVAGLLVAAVAVGCTARIQPPPRAGNGAAPDSVRVERQSPLRFLAPLDRTLIEAAVVHQLYADLQAMPVMTGSGTFHCPMDNGVSLALTFKAGESVVTQVTAGATGCRLVKLSDGTTRSGLSEPGQRFYANLSAALGLTPVSLSGEDAPAVPPAAADGSLTAATDLLTLHMVNAQSGWATGEGSVYRTGDGGRTWTAVTPPGAAVPASGGGTFFLGPDHAWVTTVQQGTRAIARTSDGGQTWQSATVPELREAGGDLYFRDDKAGWLLAHLGYAMSHEAVAVYHTDDGGATWSKLTEVDPQGEAPGGIPFGGDKTGISFSDANTGWIAGFTPLSGHVYLYATHDGGTTWAEQSPAVPSALAQASLMSYPPLIFGADAAVLPVEAGNAMLFYVTPDGGRTWTAGAPVPRTEHQVPSVWAFADMANGLVLNGTQLWRTNDGGQTWADGGEVAALDGARQLDYNGIACWALIGAQPPTRLRISLDYGQTWSPR